MSARTSRSHAQRSRVDQLTFRILHYARAVVCFAVVLGHATAADARDFLWKVTGKASVVYLVGSVHLLTQDFYPLSATLDRAFKESDLLVEETDLAELMAPASQAQMLARSMLPSTMTLESVISPATFALVTKRAQDIGLPIEPLKRFKPWALALVLSSVEWQKAGFNAELGLDRHFDDQARAEGKRVQGFESAEYQISRFDEITMEQQERLLTETLKDLDTEMTNLTTLVEAWRAGDARAVEQIVLKEVKQDPLMYQRLLVERNHNWMPQLEALLARPKPAFVVVGAAHLVGPDGLVVLLKAKGYRVEQM
jgi:uncharacterized protein YbaP (TraB family)